MNVNSSGWGRAPERETLGWKVNNMADIEVRNFPELLDAALGISKLFGDIKPWWRGQAVCSWDLLPSIYHRNMAVKERNMTFRFKNMAKARHAKCPSDTDSPGWLFLMQHYGLPTRLLDWTESLLVAMFFALEDRRYDNEHGALWALNPAQLNKCQQGDGVIFSADHPHVAPLFHEAFAPSGKQTDLVLSVLTDQMDIRQLIQQSVFTVHGSGTPINQLPGTDSFVAKMQIPKGTKEEFRELIDLLGISRAALFPDLENLAVDLCQRGFTTVA